MVGGMYALLAPGSAAGSNDCLFFRSPEMFVGTNLVSSFTSSAIASAELCFILFVGVVSSNGVPGLPSASLLLDCSFSSSSRSNNSLFFFVICRCVRSSIDRKCAFFKTEGDCAAASGSLSSAFFKSTDTRVCLSCRMRLAAEGIAMTPPPSSEGRPMSSTTGWRSFSWSSAIFFFLNCSCSSFVVGRIFFSSGCIVFGKHVAHLSQLSIMDRIIPTRVYVIVVALHETNESLKQKLSNRALFYCD
ncbi:hypothetical protein EDD86DRAFT_71973 [Gorgonomyces haynaldii]|nr:hypothetical protein EDD86DRAFT_71973 [Gorgonomyces haynaldii]